MDIDGEDDNGFFDDEYTQIISEEEGESNGGDEEDIEDLLQILTIDFGEESDFENEDVEENEDEELDDLDNQISVHNRTNDDDADSIRLLLLQLKELSDINHQGFKTNT